MGRMEASLQSQISAKFEFLTYISHRWLFLIEGLITLLIGLASFFMMPASAVETKKWFRPEGWFNDREVRIVVNRVLRDDPSKGIRKFGLCRELNQY